MKFLICSEGKPLMTVDSITVKEALSLARKTSKARNLTARRMVRLRCYKNGCGHEWFYRGRRTVNASCPNCGRQVRIDTAEVKP